MLLSPQVFAITAHLIEERSGLHYDLTSLEVLSEKLSARALERGFESLLDYYYFLRYDRQGEEEFQTLVETLVIHETYFFREVEPLRVLAAALLPKVLEVRPRVRVWSAACATGEEPYTLAMMLAERELLDRVELVASDVSERALARARAGVYAGRSFRSMPTGAPSWTHLEEAQGGMRVRKELRDHVDFRQINLLDADAVAALGTFDVVICRNVLIYFADATVGRVARTLGAALPPGGLLLVGTSESLLRFGTLFDCEEHGGAFFYRKQAP